MGAVLGHSAAARVRSLLVGSPSCKHTEAVKAMETKICAGASGFRKIKGKKLRQKKISTRIQEAISWDFLGGPGVKNLHSNPREVGSTPNWGTQIPHALGQVSPWA